MYGHVTTTTIADIYARERTYMYIYIGAQSNSLEASILSSRLPSSRVPHSRARLTPCFCFFWGFLAGRACGRFRFFGGAEGAEERERERRRRLRADFGGNFGAGFWREWIFFLWRDDEV